MQRLRNPVSGTVDDFTEGQARVRRRHGWVDADQPSTRAELDEQAEALGLDPSDYANKDEITAAIEQAK